MLFLCCPFLFAELNGVARKLRCKTKLRHTKTEEKRRGLCGGRQQGRAPPRVMELGRDASKRATENAGDATPLPRARAGRSEGYCRDPAAIRDKPSSFTGIPPPRHPPFKLQPRSTVIQPLPPRAESKCSRKQQLFAIFRGALVKRTASYPVQAAQSSPTPLVSPFTTPTGASRAAAGPVVQCPVWGPRRRRAPRGCNTLYWSVGAST